MEKKFYLDTCIWIDYLEDRKNGIKPLGELAFQFLRKCRKEKSTIIVSDVMRKELYKHIAKEEIEKRLLDFSDLIIEVKHSQEQFDEAHLFWVKTKKEFPQADILHAIISRDQKAVLISRDKHFAEIDIVEFHFPEELF
ncbi:type II toxin-antitoxin system VapC family toxin [Candidatus Micrarchaeota archaeon]|nr:type II toxin-antitoxin system VapC family toxin [Candidatus Micrarchaeota archaeon]